VIGVLKLFNTLPNIQFLKYLFFVCMVTLARSLGYDSSENSGYFAVAMQVT